MLLQSRRADEDVEIIDVTRERGCLVVAGPKSRDALRGLSYGAGSLIDTRRDAAILMAATQTKNDTAVQVVDLILDQIGRFTREPIAQRTEENTSELQSLIRHSYD